MDRLMVYLFHAVMFAWVASSGNYVAALWVVIATVYLAIAHFFSGFSKHMHKQYFDALKYIEYLESEDESVDTEGTSKGDVSEQQT